MKKTLSMFVTVICLVGFNSAHAGSQFTNIDCDNQIKTLKLDCSDSSMSPQRGGRIPKPGPLSSGSGGG